jgi:hypothetical protein
LQEEGQIQVFMDTSAWQMCPKPGEQSRASEITTGRWRHCVLGLSIRVLETDVSRRHNRRDGVLVDHLTDAVLQQHYKLVKRFDLPLQFYTVDKENGNGNAFFP